MNGATALDGGWMLMTAPTPGAVAILQVFGPGASAGLSAAFGWPEGQAARMPWGGVSLVRFGAIDQGLLVRVSDDGWQLMPHGGLRIVRGLGDALAAAGLKSKSVDRRTLFPEATSGIEADAMWWISQSSSPAAIDALAAQPAVWREAWASGVGREACCKSGEVLDARDAWLVAPTVVVVGRPNVGKSTLLNALTGRTAALVSDLPGTTRDWVGGSVELVCEGGDALRDAVAVRWLDTPGLRESGDAVEQAAIVAARSVVASADVLVAMRSPDVGWPAVEGLPREPDVWVMNKADAMGAESSERLGVLRISAKDGVGLGGLASAVLEVLGLGDVDRDRPWAFSETLRGWASLSEGEQSEYLGV